MGITNTRLNLENSIARYRGERETKAQHIARIEAEMESLTTRRERVTALDALIAAAEMLVREDNPDWSSDHIKPQRKADHHSPVPFGLLGRTALEVLRDGPPEGMRTRDIAREVIKRFDLDPDDRKLLDAKTNFLGNYLKSNNGDLVESDGEQFYKRWRLICDE